MGCSTPTSPRTRGGNTPVRCTTTTCPLDNYRITSIEVNVTAPNDIVFMNTPETGILVSAEVTYEQAENGFHFEDLVTNVLFSFTDPSSNNTEKTDSFNYTPTAYLGKKSDPSATYWEAHADHSAISGDSFRSTAKVTLEVVEENVKAETKVMFIPSGVGGDDFKITAKAFEPDGTTLADSDDTDLLVVWRKITFNAYEMDGVTSITDNGKTADMTAYYTPDTFVRYELGVVNPIVADYSVEYIGLWDHASSTMLDWSTHSAKIAAETPTPDEKAKANGSAGADQNAARAAIVTKAEAWRDRINSAYMSGLNNWATDAGVPVNSLVGIKYEHPKYSKNSPDSVTEAWLDYRWLRITVDGRRIRPDQRWIRGEGFSYGSRAYITNGMGALRTKVAIAHEAAHETKNQFKRKLFGPGDHSTLSGLMDPNGSRSSFTDTEKEVLRGFD